MISRRILIGLVTGMIGAVAASGCDRAIVNPKVNQRPTIELTRAPFDESTRFLYAYRMNWLGYDVDGKVDHYLYTVDPPTPTPANAQPETTWVQTTLSEQLIQFSASKPDSSNAAVDGASDFHTFVVKAIDNGGAGGRLQSAPIVRSFYSYTIAPTVQILQPPPSDRSPTYSPPSVLIRWTGDDEDGLFHNQKPVKYKFILLDSDPTAPVPSFVARDYPDSVRRYYAPRNWAGWDSTTADTTWHQYTGLVPQQTYVFVVIAFDEAGAYSPIFSRNSNMLELRITYASSAGPLLTIWNDFFTFSYDPGVWAPHIDRYIAKVEVAAGQPVEVNWSAVPGPGAAFVQGFRWALDIDDVYDESPRDPNEREDLAHWSQEASATTRAVVGPFGPGEIHQFYIQAIDNNGMKSLGVVRFTSVAATLEKPLLIVDDTRLKVDQRNPGVTCMSPPPSGTRWPIAAELDTFLYAKGGFPYRCYPDGTISPRGLFDGYPFDTIGTRTGKSVVRVPLAVLGQYSHVIWITDQQGARLDNAGTDIANSLTALRYMSQSGQANSLAAYIKQGGEVWMVGGGGGYATNIAFNSRTSSNDIDLPAQSPTFSFEAGELGPGRFMYDIAHWQSEFKSTSGPVRIVRNRARWDSATAVPPAYRNLPAEMRPHTRGVDPVPPLRNSSDYYYSTFEIEYLSRPNYVIQDVDPSPIGFDEQSTLDSLYHGSGQILMPPSFNRYNVCMTRYVGPAYTHLIFTGFNFWSWTRADCQALIDAVMHDMWGFPLPARGAAAMARPLPVTAAASPGRSNPVPGSPLGPDRGRSRASSGGR